MADPVTTNRGYAVPTRGSDVGTWDVPLNGDFLLIDQNLGAVSTVPLTNAPVTLSAAQYACGTIRFTGTLTADLQVIFPQVSAWWTVDNQTRGNFVVQLVCNPGGTVIGLPQAVASDVFTDGANIAFRNLAEVGSFKDYAATAAARWIGFCTIAPWLVCDGSTFSAVTFPILAQILGGTTLPDFRGRKPHFLNGGTSRLTAAGAGIDGNTLFASGGDNGLALTNGYIPSLTVTGNITVTLNGNNKIPFTNGTIIGAQYNGGSGPLGNNFPTSNAGGVGDWTSLTSITGVSQSMSYANATPTVIPDLAPGIVSGIRLIRAG